jgi:hypothetical protein
MEDKNERRPGGRGDVQGINSSARTTIPPSDWSATYDCATRWVAWNARRRWPQFAANDEVWALSVAAWWHGAVSGRG